MLVLVALVTIMAIIINSFMFLQQTRLTDCIVTKTSTQSREQQTVIVFAMYITRHQSQIQHLKQRQNGR